MPDTLDDLSQQYQNPQLWNLPPQPAPGATHEAPKPDPVAGAIQGFEHGGIQTAIEGAGAQPPEWLTHINDFLTQNKGAIDIARMFSEGLPGPGNIGMLKAVPMAGRQGVYDILGHNDERLGWIIPHYNPAKKQVYIGYYGSYGDPNLPAGSRALALNKAPWSFGKTPMEALSNQIAALQLAKDEFPEATTVLGGRATGATRGKPSRPKPLPEQTTYEKTPKTPEFLELERELGRIARENIAEHGRSPPGSLNLTPTQSPLRSAWEPAPPTEAELAELAETLRAWDLAHPR
jgi:hypothetical protein